MERDFRFTSSDMILTKKELEADCFKGSYTKRFPVIVTLKKKIPKKTDKQVQMKGVPQVSQKWIHRDTKF